MINLRASRSGLAWVCPQSIRSTDLRVGSEIPAVGQALHHWMWSAIPNGHFMEIRDCAAMFGADAEELERLVARTWEAWQSVQQYYPEPQCEIPLAADFGCMHLSGHIDLLSWTDKIRFLDWKSSWQEADSSHQMLAYAAILFAQTTTIDEVYGATIWPRQHNDIDGKTYRRDEVMAWVEGLQRRLTCPDAEVYRPGGHCIYCERSSTCPELAAEERKSQLILMADGVGELDAGNAHILYDRIRLVERACDRARTVLKAKVAAAGGQLGDLVLTEEERETIRINGHEAWEIVTANLRDSEFGQVIKASKTELKKAIMAKATHGKKSAAAEQVLEELRACGAVEKTFITKLEMRKHREQAITNKTV